jgi:spoIIIJ-associated protein
MDAGAAKTIDREALKKTISELFAAMGTDITELVVSDGPRCVIAISSADSQRLIGPRGEHLRALNMIARRLIESKHGEDAASFLIDINGYQEAQLETVRQNARVLAQRARLFKHDVELEPMNPYERLVVHELFAEDPDIKTESAGEGKFRHIVLKYRSGSAVTGSI